MASYKELLDKGREKLTELTVELMKYESVASTMQKSIGFIYETRKRLEEGSERAVQVLNLSTKDDLDQLNTKMRELNQQIENLQEELKKNNPKPRQKKKAPSSKSKSSSKTSSSPRM